MSSQAAPLGANARVLIVRTGALGDIVHALPVLSALRAQRPDVAVDWMVDARYAHVLALVDGLRHRIVIRAADESVTSDEFRFAGVRGVASAIAHLRAQLYDAALDLQGLIKSAAFARASGARRVIGFEPAALREPAARWLYRESVQYGGPHVIDKNLSALHAFVLGSTERRFPWGEIKSAASAAVRADPAVATAEGYVLLNPGAAWVNKRWPVTHFGTLAARLAERLRLTSVVLWGPGEHELASAVVAASAGSAVLAPPTALPDVLALAREATLVVSGDTGPLHLAASVGAPVVGLFGPTYPDRNGPWDSADLTVSRSATCACPYKRQCLRGAACIDTIEVEEVYDACVRRVGATVQRAV